MRQQIDKATVRHVKGIARSKQVMSEIHDLYNKKMRVSAVDKQLILTSRTKKTGVERLSLVIFRLIISFFMVFGGAGSAFMPLS